MIRLDEVFRQVVSPVFLIRVQEDSIMLRFANNLMWVSMAHENHSHRQGECNLVVLSLVVRVQE